MSLEIDTGAAVSILPATAAASDVLNLNLNIPPGIPLPLAGIGSGTVSTVLVNINARFTGTDYVFSIPVAVANTDNIPSLLGRYGFWGSPLSGVVEPSITFDNVNDETTFGTPNYTSTNNTPPISTFTNVNISPYLIAAAILGIGAIIIVVI